MPVLVSGAFTLYEGETLAASCQQEAELRNTRTDFRCSPIASCLQELCQRVKASVKGAPTSPFLFDSVSIKIIVI